ncbi:MAG TPA: hypothetical protein VGD26_13735 [Chitinophagaceae bacterium]
MKTRVFDSATTCTAEEVETGGTSGLGTMGDDATTAWEGVEDNYTTQKPSSGLARIVGLALAPLCRRSIHFFPLIWY